jgi:hypothetical protein
MKENHPMYSGLTPDEREVAARLLDAAENLQPNPYFVHEIEAKLRHEFVAKKENRMKGFNFFWQSLAGTVAVTVLTFLFVWLVRGVIPETRGTSSPGSGATSQAVALPTAALTLPAYDRQGITVYRAADFPEAPAKTNLYAYSSSKQPVTVEAVSALAKGLSINGQVAPSEDRAYRYQISDGQQRLFVNSAQDFLYFSSLSSPNALTDLPLEKARPFIEAYLKAHGFEFKHQIQAGIAPGWFMVTALTVDGRPIYSGPSQIQGLSLAISPEGQILQMQAHLLAAEGSSLGKVSILGAKEAWQKFIDPKAWPANFVISNGSPGTAVKPTLTIESIDLVYYSSDPHNQTLAGAFIQPVWRFYGHYSDGNSFEYLVQALRPE